MKLTVIFFGMLAILQPLQAQGSPPCKVDVRTPQSGAVYENKYLLGTALARPELKTRILTYSLLSDRTETLAAHSRLPQSS